MKRYYLSYADWSTTEFKAILCCILKGQINQGSFPELLRKKLSNYYTPSTVYTSNYGHHAIKTALEIFRRQMPERSEIILPAYICPSVLQSIKLCGLTPVCVDVESDLNISPAAISNAFGVKTLAVIAPHMYGCPAKIKDIEILCHEAGIFLIDDAAQVIGVRQDGRLLGSFGDVGILSFAQSKTIVTGVRGSGGALLINKTRHQQDASKLARLLPPANKRFTVLIEFLWSYLWDKYTKNSTYYLGRLVKRLGLKTKNSITYSEISNIEAAIAIEQFKRIDQIVLEKIRIVEAYKQALGSQTILSFPQYSLGKFLARVMLLLPEGINAKILRKILSKHGLDIRLGYDACVIEGKNNKNAEELAPRLIGVPCVPGMSNVEINEICKIILEAISVILLTRTSTSLNLH